MKYLDTFSGYGGFTLGIQRAFGDNLRDGNWQATKGNGEAETPITSVEATEADTQRQGDTPSSVRTGTPRQVSCIGFSEINKYAIQVYEKHFPEHINYGDITKINPTELPDFDLLTGGFPCQAFSIAGKRQGFNDTRGTLFFDIARILKEKRPRNFILENVKGLLSHDNGRTFKTIITTLTELGYCVEWQVLNAKDFGVPQNRERVFIVGHLGGVPERKVFPLWGSGEKNKILSKVWYANGSGEIEPIAIIPENHKPKGNYLPRERVFSTRGIARALATAREHLPWYEEVESYEIRRLTPKECERLMGLPDDWTDGQSDTQRYKLCGNGVVVNVVEAVVRKLYNLYV